MVIIMKLITSETLVGLLALEDENEIILQDPFLIEYRFDSKGSRSMVLSRYNQFSLEDNTSFNKSMVVTYFAADDDLKEYYFYSLDHSIKVRDEYIAEDIRRASEYLQHLIDDLDKPKSNTPEIIVENNSISSNTVH